MGNSSSHLHVTSQHTGTVFALICGWAEKSWWNLWRGPTEELTLHIQGHTACPLGDYNLNWCLSKSKVCPLSNNWDSVCTGPRRAPDHGHSPLQLLLLYPTPCCEKCLPLINSHLVQQQRIHPKNHRTEKSGCEDSRWFPCHESSFTKAWQHPSVSQNRICWRLGD